MKRDEWEFPYTTQTVLEGAKKKLAFHQSRLDFWQNKKEEVKAKVKAEGVNFSESQSDIISNAYRSSSITVENGLLTDFQECVEKVKEHMGKIKDYNSWVEVLSATYQPLVLNYDDWLFFFSE